MDSNSNQNTGAKITPPAPQPVSGSRCLAEEFIQSVSSNSSETITQKVGYTYSDTTSKSPASVKLLDSDWTPHTPYKEYTKEQLEAYILLLQSVSKNL